MYNSFLNIEQFYTILRFLIIITDLKKQKIIVGSKSIETVLILLNNNSFINLFILTVFIFQKIVQRKWKGVCPSWVKRIRSIVLQQRTEANQRSSN